eukprot:COSAG05_NODE_596_length_8452_cov_10.143302_5_plen_458_part_00
MGESADEAAGEAADEEAAKADTAQYYGRESGSYEALVLENLQLPWQSKVSRWNYRQKGLEQLVEPAEAAAAAEPEPQLPGFGDSSEEEEPRYLGWANEVTKEEAELARNTLSSYGSWREPRVSLVPERAQPLPKYSRWKREQEAELVAAMESELRWTSHRGSGDSKVERWYNLPSESEMAAQRSRPPGEGSEQNAGAGTPLRSEWDGENSRSLNELRRLEASLLALVGAAEDDFELAQYLSAEQGGGPEGQTRAKQQLHGRRAIERAQTDLEVKTDKEAKAALEPIVSTRQKAKPSPWFDARFALRRAKGLLQRQSGWRAETAEEEHAVWREVRVAANAAVQRAHQGVVDDDGEADMYLQKLATAEASQNLEKWLRIALRFVRSVYCCHSLYCVPLHDTLSVRLLSCSRERLRQAQVRENAITTSLQRRHHRTAAELRAGHEALQALRQRDAKVRAS